VVVVDLKSILRVTDCTFSRQHHVKQCWRQVEASCNNVVTYTQKPTTVPPLGATGNNTLELGAFWFCSDFLMQRFTSTLLEVMTHAKTF
jgi:hypothetical protein